MHFFPDTRRTFRRAGQLCAALLMLAPSGVADAAHTPPRVLFHLRLEKSEPAPGAELSKAPSAIRLWFSLPPEMGVTAVRLVDEGGKARALGQPTRGAGAKDPVVADIRETLAAGRYTVSWRTSSKDGHPIKGEFAFSVKASAH